MSLDKENWVLDALVMIAKSDFAKRYFTDNSFSLLPLPKVTNGKQSIIIGYASVSPPSALLFENEVYPPFAYAEVNYPSKTYQVTLLTKELYEKTFVNINIQDSLINNKLLNSITIPANELSQIDYYEDLSRTLAFESVVRFSKNATEIELALKILKYFKHIPDELFNFYAKEGEELYKWLQAII